MKSSLTPRQAAQSLGVSESSLKRWCDQGRLPFQKTAGGHRRIPVRAVVRFVRENQREVVRPEILGLPVNVSKPERRLSQSVDILVDLLVRGDETSSRRIVLEHFLSGVPTARISDELIAPVFELIGDHWERGKADIFEEHRAVQIVERILLELRTVIGAPPPKDSLAAIGGSADGDPYGLPTRMVELALLELGINAVSMGASLPFDTIANAIRKEKPRFVWLSVSAIQNSEVFAAQLPRFR